MTIEFGNRFSDEEICRDHLFSVKYPEGFVCKNCKGADYYRLNEKRNRVLQCKLCRKQESLTANAIFQSTRTPLLKWFWAFYCMPQHKKGISSVQLGINIDTSDMTA